MTPAERERDAVTRARDCTRLSAAVRAAIRAIVRDLFEAGGSLVTAPQWTPPPEWGVDAVSTPRGPSPVEGSPSIGPSPETCPRFPPSVPVAIFEGLR